MRVNVLLILFASVLICLVGGDSIIKPCRPEDINCITKAMSELLSKTSAGVPEYDTRPIDPFLISSTEFKAPDESGMIFHYKNLKVTGLKDQKFTDCKFDLTKKDALWTANADLNVEGDVNVEFSKDSKTFAGTFTLSGKVECTIAYNISMNVDDKAVSHFIAGPEEVACKTLDETVLTVGPELEQAFLADPEIQASKEKNKEKTQALRKEFLSHIAVKSYEALTYNLRAAAKKISISDFLIQA